MKTKRARKGSGRVYQSRFLRAGKPVLGGWRVRYAWRGRRYDERVPEEWPKTKEGAQSFLKKRYAEQYSGEFSLGAKELSYENLRDNLLDFYELNGIKGLKMARDGKTRYVSGQSHLDRFFKGRRAIDITTDAVEAFIRDLKRKDALKSKPTSNSKLNASLQLLQSMFHVAAGKKNKGRIGGKKLMSLADVPKIEKFKADPARKGFLEPRDFPKLLAALPEDLRLVLTLDFDCGMRLGEVQRLRWAGVDLIAGEINLTAEETKTSRPRIIPLGRSLEAFRHLRSSHPRDVYVFGGAKPLGSFRKRWNTACVVAGFGKFICAQCLKPIAEHDCKSTERRYKGLTFHDLRRSAVRNMVRGGTPENVAMKISGHSTRSIFDRYNITTTTDIHEAAKRTNDYVERLIGEKQGKIEREADPTGADEKSLIQ